jgi:cytoskeletal protein CcmA (bactofilin family)
MMRFLNRASDPEEAAAAPNTMIGVGSSVRGTLMVQGTLRIEGEFEGDILNCARLEVGEHGLMRADVEVKEAVIYGRIIGNIRALGTVELKAGSRLEGDVAALSVVMEQGVYFSGRCTMLDSGASSSVEMGSELGRYREPQRT